MGRAVARFLFGRLFLAILLSLLCLFDVTLVSQSARQLVDRVCFYRHFTRCETLAEVWWRRY